MLQSLKSRAVAAGIPWQTLLKEALQVSFLESFLELPQASQATFQGGTCLHLVYGGPRHSEDLDFVVEAPLASWEELRQAVFKGLRKREALLQGSLELSAQKNYSKILRWKLKWTPPEGREKVFVRVEFAAYPARTRELKPLASAPGLPSVSWVLVPVETREEILTDKLAAIAGRPYLKGRDFFDLWFLRSQGVSLDAGLLRQKLADYSASWDALARRQREITGDILGRDLGPFLPSALREPLAAENYRGVLAAARETIQAAVQALRR